MYRVRNVPVMAFRTWGRLLLTALGVSVLAGAGQLGVAYGFGIVRLTGAFTGTTVNQWPAQLVWVGWFAANAAVAGAVLTGRLARRDAPAASTGRQLAIGGAAALGATVIAPLCMQPARAAELISVDPVWAVGICAVLGAVIGAGAAIAVLLRPELGWNMAAVAGAVWLLALISVLPSLGTAGPLPTVRLGVLEPSWLDDAAAQRLALLLLPTVALLAGAATAGLARWRGQAPLVSGATGVAGPVLVAFAYLTAGPGDAVDRYQVSPYYGALIAILAGALGAAAAALLRWPAGTRAADPQAIEPSRHPAPAARQPASCPAPHRRVRRTTGTASAPTRSRRRRLATAEPPAGATPGPRAAGGSDGVRTVPAHWDWPATTASGQHGPAPAARRHPRRGGPIRAAAAALTAPTGEVTAAGDTPRPTPRPGHRPSRSTGAAPSRRRPAATSTTAGHADAATPAAGPDDEPTGSATTAGRPTDRRPHRPARHTPHRRDAEQHGPIQHRHDQHRHDQRGRPARARPAQDRPARAPEPAQARPAQAPTSAGPTSTGTTRAQAATSTERTRRGHAQHGHRRRRHGQHGWDSAGTPTQARPAPGAADAGAAEATPDATAPTVAEGQPAAATSDTPDDAPPTCRTTTARRPPAGPRRSPGPASRPTAPARRGHRHSGAQPESQDTASGLTTEARSVPRRQPESPHRRQRAGHPATGPHRAPRPPNRLPPGRQPGPAHGPTRTSRTGDRGAGTTPTAATDPNRRTRPAAHAAAATGRLPPAAGRAGRTADVPASGSTAARARDTDSARPAAEDVPAAGLFGATAAQRPGRGPVDAARRAWPVASAWTVPPQASDAGAHGVGAGRAGPTRRAGPTAQPPALSHRLPDLSRAGTW